MGQVDRDRGREGGDSQPSKERGSPPHRVTCFTSGPSDMWTIFPHPPPRPGPARNLTEHTPSVGKSVPPAASGTEGPSRPSKGLLPYQHPKSVSREPLTSTSAPGPPLLPQQPPRLHLPQDTQPSLCTLGPAPQLQTCFTLASRPAGLGAQNTLCYGMQHPTAAGHRGSRRRTSVARRNGGLRRQPPPGRPGLLRALRLAAPGA